MSAIFDWVNSSIHIIEVSLLASLRPVDVNQPRLAFQNPVEDAVEAQMDIKDEFEVVR